MMKKLILCVLSVSAISALSFAEAKQYYRYKDEAGNTVITTVVTADKAKLGYDIIDVNGRVIKTVDRGDPEVLKKKIEAENLKKAQQDYDVNLLRRYSFVNDIESEKKRKMAELKATVQIVKGNLSAIRVELEGEYAKASTIERQNRPVPDDLKQKISAVEASARSTEELYKVRQQDILDEEATYDKAIIRFKELQKMRGKLE